MTHIGTRRRVVVRRWATYSVFQGSCAKGRWLAWGCGGIKESFPDVVGSTKYIYLLSQRWQDGLMTSAVPQSAG